MRTITQQSNPENPLIRKIVVQTIAAALVLAMAFTFNACSSDDGDGGGGGVSFNENSQIYEYFDEDGNYSEKAYKGNGVIKVLICNENLLLDAGSVTDGIVNLQLPSPSNIPEECLEPFTSLIMGGYRDGCSINPSDVKITMSDAFYFEDSENGKTRYLEISSDRYNGNDDGDYVYFIYATKKATISCNNAKSGEHEYNNNISLNLVEGWNKVYIQFIEDEIKFPNPKEFKMSTDNFLLEELKWKIYY